MRRLAALVVVAVLAAGCQTMTGRSMARWADDRTITAHVKTRLAAEHPLTFTRIHVDTYDGVVYLTGAVAREDLRARVEELVQAVPDARQVVTNLKVLAENGALSASPATAPGASTAAYRHPLLGRVRAFARVEGQPPGPFVAYDANGRVVATVYTVGMRDLADRGFEQTAPAGRPVDHVAIYPVAGIPDVPEAQYHLVLWHVRRTEEPRRP